MSKYSGITINSHFTRIYQVLQIKPTTQWLYL